MIRVKTSTLDGPALDWAVAKAEDGEELAGGWHPHTWVRGGRRELRGTPYTPSTNWSQGGPIKTSNRISTQQKHDGWWLACIYDISDEMTHIQLSHGELEAAMRCFVASKLGDEVDVPEELSRKV